MDERIYAQKVSRLGDSINKAAEKYADYSQTANFKTVEDIDVFRNGWLLIVDDFRIVQTEINEIKIPNSLVYDGEKLRIAYQKYVDLVEEKTMKFSIETLNSGELDIIQKLELEQSQKIKEITREIVSKVLN